MTQQHTTYANTIKALEQHPACIRTFISDIARESIFDQSVFDFAVDHIAAVWEMEDISNDDALMIISRIRAATDAHHSLVLVSMHHPDVLS